MNIKLLALLTSLTSLALIALNLSGCCSGSIGSDQDFPEVIQYRIDQVEANSLTLVDLDSESEFQLVTVKQEDFYRFQGNSAQGTIDVSILPAGLDRGDVISPVFCLVHDGIGSPCVASEEPTLRDIDADMTDCPESPTESGTCRAQFTFADPRLTFDLEGKRYRLKGELQILWEVDYTPAHTECVSE